MNNGWKLCFNSCLYGMATYFSANFFTIHFMNLGVTSAQLGLVMTLVNITNIGVSMLLSKLADKISSTRLKRSVVTVLLVLAAVLLLFLPIRRLSGAHLSFMFPAYGVVSVAVSALNAVFALCTYKMMYCVLDKSNYNQFTALSGLLCGALSLVLSMASTAMFAHYEFGQVMDGGLALQVVFMLLSALAVACMHFNRQSSEETQGSAEKKSLSLRQIFRLPSFSSLIIPNFLRGIAASVPTVCMIFALKQCNFDDAWATLIPTVMIVANLLASMLYGILTRRVPAEKLLTLGAFMMFAFPAMCHLGQIPFLPGFFLFYLGQNFVGNAVPYMVFRIIPYEIAGTYNTWRLLIQTVGTTLGTAVLTSLVDQIPLMPVIVAAVICQVVSSVIYTNRYHTELKMIEET